MKKKNQTNKQELSIHDHMGIAIFVFPENLNMPLRIFIFPSHQTDFLVLFDNNRSKSKS